MAVKFDKETLKKHHFWFLLMPIGVFLMLVWYALLIDVPEDIEGKQKANEAKKKTLAAGVKAMPRKALDEYGTQIKQLDDQRTILWKEGWAEQKDLFKWPSGYTDRQLDILKNLKFGDEIPLERAESVRDQFREHKVYENEFRELLKFIEPLQLRDNWESALRYVRRWGPVPSSEDMWLAMEDLWIQRELLQTIAQVNQDAARFTHVKSDPDKPLHRVFRGRLWEVDLQVVEIKGRQTMKGKLKNVSGRLQVMGIGNTMKLRVTLSGKQFDFEVQGDPVEADGELEVKLLGSHALPPNSNAKSIDAVEQIFDARTVPVKRIDQLKLDKLSDRNKDLPLQMARFSERLAEKEGGVSAAAPAAVPVPVPMPGAEGETAAPVPTKPPFSQNGLVRYRYIKVTEQIRRMPIGIVVIIDQSFMKDMMETLLKSRMRFQMTQVNWVRFHGALNYGPAADAAQPGRPNPLGGGSGGPTNSREDQFSANLMELSIYGIISIYEKAP